MPVQILSDAEVIYEFDSEFELGFLVNILAHAKFGDGMRWEYTLSPIANDLIEALTGYLHKNFATDGTRKQLFPGSGPHEINDGGALRMQIETMLEYKGIERDSQEWKKQLKVGMYPWK